MKTNRIICGDAKEVLSGFPTESVDLVVTSPPYDNLRDYSGYSFDSESIAKQLCRVLKKGGVIVWVVGDASIKGSETGSSFRQALYFMTLGLRLHDTMIYAKNSFKHPSVNRYHQVFEYMFVVSKGKLKTFNPIRDRKNKYPRMGGDCSRQKDGTMKRGSRGGIPFKEYGQRFNIWTYVVGGGHISSDRIAHKHPAAFPEQLAVDHIKSWSNLNDIVLDPMCGSGTTCIAALSLRRKYIGIDASRKYCRLTERRIRCGVK